MQVPILLKIQNRKKQGGAILSEFETLSSSIFVSPRNRMSGKINIIGVGSEALESTITVKRYDDQSASMIVYSDEVIVNPSYPPIVGNQKKSNLFIPYRENLASSIKIKPKNKMTGTVEVLEPPTYYMELQAVKDSFVRSQIPTLNYGISQTLVVGYNGVENDTFRTLIKFDTNQIPENSKIQSVKLRLFNRQNNTYTHQVGVYSVSTDWLEYGVTWANQPAVKTLIGVAELGAIGYSDIDVTNIIREWYENPQSNHGFLIRAFNENLNQIEQFSSRENSINQPYLDIEYKLDIIYSTGRSSLESAMFVHAYGESSVSSSITIPEYNADRELQSSIRVTNYNYMMESSIDINKPLLPSEITVRQTVLDDINSSIVVRKLGFDKLDSLLSISKPFINSSIVVRQKEYHELTSSVLVQKWIVDEDDLPSNLVISKPFVNSNLIVRQEESQEISGNIKLRFKQEISSNMHISRPTVNGNITVRQKDSTDLVSNVQVMLRQDIPSSISISKPFVHSGITIKNHENISGDIFVKNISNLVSGITIPHTKNLTSSINITNATHLSGAIDVMSGYLRSNIIIPRQGDSIKIANVTIRVLGISEINSSIKVGGDNIPSGYVYLF